MAGIRGGAEMVGPEQAPKRRSRLTAARGKTVHLDLHGMLKIEHGACHTHPGKNSDWAAAGRRF